MLKQNTRDQHNQYPTASHNNYKITIHNSFPIFSDKLQRKKRPFPGWKLDLKKKTAPNKEIFECWRETKKATPSAYGGQSPEVKLCLNCFFTQTLYKLITPLFWQMNRSRHAVRLSNTYSARGIFHFGLRDCRENDPWRFMFILKINLYLKTSFGACSTLVRFGVYYLNASFCYKLKKRERCIAMRWCAYGIFRWGRVFVTSGWVRYGGPEGTSQTCTVITVNIDGFTPKPKLFVWFKWLIAVWGQIWEYSRSSKYVNYDVPSGPP